MMFNTVPQRNREHRENPFIVSLTGFRSSEFIRVHLRLTANCLILLAVKKEI